MPHLQRGRGLSPRHRKTLWWECEGNALKAFLCRAPAPFALYAPTPADVLRKVEQASGLPLLLPRIAPYLTQRVPRFISLASGREALDAMGEAWALEDAGWWALPDGRVF